MKWIARIREKIKANSKKQTEESELKKSNWGRSFGWFIEYKGQIIGELIDEEFDDMFWVRYTISPYPDFKYFLLQHENWMLGDFKYLNKHYKQYAENAVCGPQIDEENNSYTIIMRSLYLVSIESE